MTRGGERDRGQEVRAAALGERGYTYGRAIYFTTAKAKSGMVLGRLITG